MDLSNTYTSTGAKFFAHQEAMQNLRNGRGQPIVTHIMLTDVCNHTCAFCSVQARAGDSLPFDTIMEYLDILDRYGLKAVILSGGGNPILYKCKATGKNFNDVVNALFVRGYDIGLITNGMPLTEYDEEWHPVPGSRTHLPRKRRSWKTVQPAVLDRLTWVRISMSGLDHDEPVYVPDIDPTKTTLGFSYVAHDIYNEPADKHHGKVSRQLDLITDKGRRPTISFDERLDELEEQLEQYCRKYKPAYLRLLPNCLEPHLIKARSGTLELMARRINFHINRETAFIQVKPPAAPRACYLGYIHPVLNCDGYVYPCDSCVLNETAGHAFANPWRMCHWSEIGSIYDKPVRSLIEDPAALCPGCVFTGSNEILDKVVNDTRFALPTINAMPKHMNFV